MCKSLSFLTSIAHSVCRVIHASTHNQLSSLCSFPAEATNPTGHRYRKQNGVWREWKAKEACNKIARGYREGRVSICGNKQREALKHKHKKQIHVVWIPKKKVENWEQRNRRRRRRKRRKTRRKIGN